MDIIIGFPRKVRQHDSIMVVVDRLTNVVHFILVKYIFSASDVAHVFIRDVVKLNGVSKNFVLDRNVKFTSQFWDCPCTDKASPFWLSIFFRLISSVSKAETISSNCKAVTLLPIAITRLSHKSGREHNKLMLTNLLQY